MQGLNPYLLLWQADSLPLSCLGRPIDFLYTPIITIPHPSGTFVTICEPTLKYHNHPRFIVHVRLHSQHCILHEFRQMYKDMLDKAMAPHSSTLAWKIPWTEEPGRPQSMRSLRVGPDFTFTFHFHALEKEMATHSSVLAWRIPGTGEPGGLPSMGSHRVGHD